jgi:hypothetical protein
VPIVPASLVRAFPISTSGARPPACAYSGGICGHLSLNLIKEKYSYEPEQVQREAVGFEVWNPATYAFKNHLPFARATLWHPTGI